MPSRDCELLATQYCPPHTRNGYVIHTEKTHRVNGTKTTHSEEESVSAAAAVAVPDNNTHGDVKNKSCLFGGGGGGVGTREPQGKTTSPSHNFKEDSHEAEEGLWGNGNTGKRKTGPGINALSGYGNMVGTSSGLSRSEDRSEEGDLKEVLCKTLEKRHVHDVYEETAHHFTQAKYKPWPKVKAFLEELPPGSVVADIGCGHGKYLDLSPCVYKLGSDRSTQLVQIAAQHSHEVMVCDNLYLPYRTGCFDAVISVGVIHHLTSPQRRLQAITELARVLRPGGRVLIYVWALEQKHRKFGAQDVLVPWHLKQKTSKQRRQLVSTDSRVSSTSSVSGEEDHNGLIQDAYCCHPQQSTNKNFLCETRPDLDILLANNGQDAVREVSCSTCKNGGVPISFSEPKIGLLHKISHGEKFCSPGIDSSSGSSTIGVSNGDKFCSSGINASRSSTIGVSNGDRYCSSGINASSRPFTVGVSNGVKYVKYKASSCQSSPLSKDCNLPNEDTSTNLIKSYQEQKSKGNEMGERHMTSNQQVVFKHKISTSLSCQPSKLKCGINDKAGQASHHICTCKSRIVASSASNQPADTSFGALVRKKLNSLFSFGNSNNKADRKQTGGGTDTVVDSHTVSGPLFPGCCCKPTTMLCSGFAVREFPQSSRPGRDSSVTGSPQKRDNFVADFTKKQHFIEGDGIEDTISSQMDPSSKYGNIVDSLRLQLMSCATQQRSQDLSLCSHNSACHCLNSAQKLDCSTRLEHSSDKCQKCPTPGEHNRKSNSECKELNKVSNMKLCQGHSGKGDIDDSVHFTLGDEDSHWLTTAGEAIQRMELAVLDKTNQVRQSGIRPGEGISGRISTPKLLRQNLSQSSSVSSFSSENFSDNEVEETRFAGSTCNVKQALTCNSLEMEKALHHQNFKQNGGSPRMTLKSKSLSVNSDKSDEVFDESRDTYKRYYHVFKENELDDLITKNVKCLKLVHSAYDHANWYIIAEKLDVCEP